MWTHLGLCGVLESVLMWVWERSGVMCVSEDLSVSDHYGRWGGGAWMRTLTVVDLEELRSTDLSIFDYRKVSPPWFNVNHISICLGDIFIRSISFQVNSIRAYYKWAIFHFCNSSAPFHLWIKLEALKASEWAIIVKGSCRTENPWDVALVHKEKTKCCVIGLRSVALRLTLSLQNLTRRGHIPPRNGSTPTGSCSFPTQITDWTTIF